MLRAPPHPAQRQPYQRRLHPPRHGPRQAHRRACLSGNGAPFARLGAESAPSRCSSSAPAAPASSWRRRSCRTASGSYRPVCFVDDDPARRACASTACPSSATATTSPRSSRSTSVDLVALAIPSASGARHPRAAGSLRVRPTCPCASSPGWTTSSAARPKPGEMREVTIDDLIERDPVDIDKRGLPRDRIARPLRPDHRRRRLHRLRAGAAGPRLRAGQPAPLRRQRGRPPRAPRRAQPALRGVPDQALDGQHRRQEQGLPGVRRRPAPRRLPFRRLQARPPDGGEPRPGLPTSTSSAP